MKLFRTNSTRLRHDAAWGGGEAWVARVARALVRRSRRSDERSGDGSAPSARGGLSIFSVEGGLDPRDLRIDGRPAVDADRTHRLLVQSVMQLPSADRQAILDRFRDSRRLETMARARGARPADVERVLGEALDTIGERVRARLGGGGGVYLASLTLLERDVRAAARRPLPARGPLAAAAVVLIGLAALLVRGGLPDGSGAGLVAGIDSTVASNRVELPRGSGTVDPQRPVPSQVDAASAVAIAAVEAGLQLVGRVVDVTGAPLAVDGREAGVLRGVGPAEVRQVPIDRLGRFSLAGLQPGTWTLTAQVDGYVTVRQDVELTADVEGGILTTELVTRRAERIEVEVFASSDLLGADSVGIHAVPGSADDWAITHGLTVVATRQSPGERLAVSPGRESWNELTSFERMAPPDMARPALVGTLVAARPEAARQVHLLFGDFVLASIDWQPGIDLVRFDVSMERIDELRASVALQLRGLDGIDLTGARVTLIGPNGEIIERRLGPDGMLDVSGLPPGSWVVEIWAGRNGRMLRAIDLDGGVDHDGEDVEVSGSIPLSGSVIDLAGNAIGALVRALPLDGFEHPLSLEQSPTTNAYPVGQGKFDFGDDLSGGNDWVVVLDEPGYALQAKAVGEDGANIKFKAEKGQTVSFTWSNGSADQGSYALLLDSKSLPLKVLPLNYDLFSSVELSNGDYNLVLWSGGVWGTQIPFSVDGSKATVPLD